MVLPCHFHVQKPSVRAYLSVPIVFSRDAEPKAPVRRSRKDLKHPTSTLAITSCTVDTMVHHHTPNGCVSIIQRVHLLSPSSLTSS